MRWKIIVEVQYQKLNSNQLFYIYLLFPLKATFLYLKDYQLIFIITAFSMAIDKTDTLDAHDAVKHIYVY